MVIYHAISTYQLLSMMIHKLIYHSNDKAIIMISDTLCEKYPKYKQLENYFDDIIEFKLSLPVKKNKFNITVNQYFNELLKKYQYDLSSFENIYVGCAHFYFGIYLALNDVPFIFFEDASGLLSRPDVLISIDSSNKIKHDYNLKYGLYDGSNKNITKRICNMNAQVEGFKDKEAEHFDVIENLLKLDLEDRNEIRNFFTDLENINVPANSVIFLTQHFFNLEILSFEQQVLIYKLVIDYFFEHESIVFKPHPDDIMYYNEIFPNSKIIKEKFPSEILPIIFSKKPETIATISSTSINNLYNYFDNSFELNRQFENDFQQIHKYYTCLMLCDSISKKKIGLYGCNKLLLDRLCNVKNLHFNFENYKDDILMQNNKSDVYIIDDVSILNDINSENIIKALEKFDESKIFIFMNSKKDYCFYSINHKKLWNYIIPIVIQKTALKTDEFYADMEEEVIYVYCKNEEVRNKMGKVRFTKELKNTGLEINVDNMTPEQQKIKILEGILKATEERLLYYINLVNEKKEL